MYSMRMGWKEVSVNLENLESHMRANFPQYVGNQAASTLDLYFSEELSQEDKDAIQAHWESLDGSDYKSQQTLASEAIELEEAIKVAKLTMISKTWTSMSEVERKLVLGLSVTRQEMGL